MCVGRGRVGSLPGSCLVRFLLPMDAEERSMLQARTLALSILILAGAITTTADPRWWQHDRAITLGGPAQTNPDIALADGQGGVGGFGYFVVWEEPSLPPGSTQDIWLTASFDGGCSWCTPRLWAAGALDETLPRIEAGVVGSSISIQVVYENGGQVYLSGDATLQLGDPDKCRVLATLPVPTPIQLSRPFNTPNETDHRPRIRAVGRFAPGAAWPCLPRGLPGPREADRDHRADE